MENLVDRQSAAEALDAIFGEGSAEQAWSGAELEEARKPHDPAPVAPTHSVKLKVTPSGAVSPTHPDADLGRHGEARTVMVYEIPAGTPVSEVVRLYSASVDIATRTPAMYKFAELGIGRILGDWLDKTR